MSETERVVTRRLETSSRVRRFSNDPQVRDGRAGPGPKKSLHVGYRPLNGSSFSSVCNPGTYQGQQRENTPGSYECSDINECASSSTHNCRGGSSCTNSENGFRCVCPSGYKIGRTSSSNEFRCFDRNECLEDQGTVFNCVTTPGRPTATCSNLPGSYTCCPTGTMVCWGNTCACI